MRPFAATAVKGCSRFRHSSCNQGRQNCAVIISLVLGVFSIRSTNRQLRQNEEQLEQAAHPGTRRWGIPDAKRTANLPRSLERKVIT
jgi:hypothetical protein